MSTISQSRSPRLKYHPAAYEFVNLALQYTQRMQRREHGPRQSGEEEHITGQELLEGIRVLAIRQFGFMAHTVFRQWGVRATNDFGHIVFHLVECGQMRKTESDQLSDFCDVYDFEEAFEREIEIDTSSAFREQGSW